MNCILLNNEFNLKEPLVIKYHGKTKKKKRRSFIKQEVLFWAFYDGYCILIWKGQKQPQDKLTFYSVSISIKRSKNSPLDHKKSTKEFHDL